MRKGYRPTSSGAPTGSIWDIWYGTKLYNRAIMKTIRSLLIFERSKTAQIRKDILTFHQNHGTPATIDAYGISKASLYRWKKALQDNEGRLDSLVPLSKTPHKKRTMITHYKVISFIKKLREKRPRLGKEKIKPLLDEYCQTKDIPPISISTIGKVIKRHNLFMRPQRIYHNPCSGYAKRKVNYKKKVRHSPKVTNIGYVEIDTITRFLNGLKVYVFNAVDVKAKFQFSYGYTRLTSRNGLDFFKKLQAVYPVANGIHTVQTDNGLEYIGEFHEYLETTKIQHLFIYPRCPKINAYIERANRTLSEEFLEGHLEYLLDGLVAFNQRLIDYLIWYNTKRVHKALGNITPMDYLLSIIPHQSHIYVTHTAY
ncbi:integrase core domain-containing protein [Candidatus Woesebacteria bacterium]|nr:integrase core domain-containing protein [Candidatus Woesebacteria bacterium]